MIFLLLNVLLVVVAIVVAWRLWRALALYRVRTTTRSSDQKTPSVSVCIPARNEMHALAECLERVLASDYQKMEILVYDDSSADDTSVLIKSFAHAGVRFVPGTHLPEGWLGKNHALEVLLNEASGSIIVFMDVDTQIQPTTISHIVAAYQSKQVEMVSVLPMRSDSWRGSVLFGTLRYFWQLVAPGAHYPATSSAFWMIKRSTLMDQMGGLRAFSTSVEPEAHIARKLGASYLALISDSILGVSFEKKWSSQCETAKRLLFPQFGGKWWSVLLGCIVLLLLNLPTFLVLGGLMQWTHFHEFSVFILVAFIVLYGLYLNRMWARGWWLGAFFWPYVIFQELVLFVLSVISYATGTVTWKGRRVTATRAVAVKEG